VRVDAVSLLRNTTVAAAAFAFVAHLLLLLGAAVPAWLLPATLFGAVAASLRGRSRAMADEHAGGPTAAPAPRWLVVGGATTIAALAAALTYGSIATPSRAWDGVVAWDLKARALSHATTLAQPLFADAAALHHSPDYPLLQPLALASLAHWFGDDAARCWFGLLFVALAAAVGITVAASTQSRCVGWIAAVGVATTPFFANPSGGGADSGYAELLLANAIAAGAVGLVLTDAPLIAGAAVLLPFCKPEGSVYAALLAATSFVVAPRRVAIAAMLGGGAAAAIWLPLQFRLGHAEPSSTLAVLVPALALVGCVVRWRMDRAAARTSHRLLALGLAGALALAVLGSVGDRLAGHDSPLLGHYLGGLGRAPDRLAALPGTLFAMLGLLLQPNRFGLTLPLLGLVLWHAARRGSQFAGLHAWLVGGAVVVAAATLLTPENDLHHFVRSSGARLGAHWLGTAWITIGIGLAAASRPRGEPAGATTNAA
jgi:hypothetical protein